MTKWTCTSCNGTTLTATATEQPKFCIPCGNNELTKIDARRQLNKYDDNKKEFMEVVGKLNALCEEMQPARKRYAQLMQYFRMKRANGAITQEEYDEIANMFKYGREKKPAA